MSLSHRLKPLDSQRLTVPSSSDDIKFGELDRRVNAIEMLAGHRQWCDELKQVLDDILAVRKDVENHSDQLRGVSIVLEDRQLRETKKVVNTMSGVEHQAIISLSASPHTWRTKCGWRFAGKFNAETFEADATLIHTYRQCPKCHLLPESQDDTSTSSDGTDD